jgi:cytochrome c-type biogenesis protein
MASFGLGAAIPLGFVGLISRAMFLRWRGVALHGGHSLKVAFGLLLIVLGAGIVSGADRQMEAWLVDASPDWLTRMTTRF